MSESILTHEYLKEHLHYSVITGKFYWLESASKRIKTNDVAGNLTCKDYRRIRINGSNYFAHRLAWFWVTGEWPEKQIDHKNRIRDDNYWLNIREATQSQNNYNKGISPTNSSGFKGVYWYKTYQKWRANIRINGKKKHLGYFDSPELAHKAYVKAGKEHHGEFFLANPL
jgi:hypothetical protein